MDTGPDNAAQYPETFSPSEAAETLGLSKTRVLQMLKDDPPELLGHQDGRGRWRIPASHVEALRRRRSHEKEHRPRQSRDDKQVGAGQEPALVEALRGEIEHLRKESERKDTIIMTLSQSNAEQARTIRAIEAPADAEGTPDAPESATAGASRGTAPPGGTGRQTETSRVSEPPQRPWWRRVIGR